ncbi:MAG TPA: bifunctional precorrin-2 dehydrogenase/sirohydrochlorin ferrochelatase [Nitrospinaceae bacterium]|jgi:precorrin-2 dehydrogenase/sirohydrochlorin ferrochelatase|nr:bifunctional precorrin-2 dehydrogenase/sirohydrochlorin ferrochelatase [Nitrospinaceae bacterium]
MIVDLNLIGKRVLVIGGGNESSRKVEALLSQQCEIFVVAERVEKSIKNYSKEGKISLDLKRIDDINFLKNYQQLDLILATSDDPALNRKILIAGKEKYGCYVYAADDPQVSDFSHPSVINIKDTVQIGISTGGRSPLMGKSLRKTLEPLIKISISDLILMQINLQDQLRIEAKKIISSVANRKKFLTELLVDEKVNQYLEDKKFSIARELAIERLNSFIKKNPNAC